MTAFGNAYLGRRVLLTGHTGFKGSWLALWLQALGAKIIGLALVPKSSPAHWDLLGLNIDDNRMNVCDRKAVAELVLSSSPEIVFHLAAQSLVRHSYLNPLETWDTNVMGTANVLEACRHQPSVRAIIVVTTDKCYENREQKRGYLEMDRLGGHDPYSASKAGAELVVSSYRHAFFNQENAPLLASVRAGNAIGGGDWSEDRLIPDLVRAVSKGETLEIRFPSATRPWQHVLESLSGYLCLGQKLIEGREGFAEAWNFGPDESDDRTVEMVLAQMKEHWPSIAWQVADSPQLHETSLLYLDSSKARQRLGWQPVWSFDEGLGATANWYKANIEHETVISFNQLKSYTAAARLKKLDWSVL